MKALHLGLIAFLAVCCSAYPQYCKVRNVQRDCPTISCIEYVKDHMGCLTCKCNPNPSFWGDIKLTPNLVSYINERLEHGKGTKGAGTIKYFRWNNIPITGGLYNIPFLLDSSLASSAIEAIGLAITDITANTCLRFIQRTTEPEYMNFVGNLEGCWAYVGRIGGPNTISIQAPGCDTKGTVIHEIMHSLGFFHEHQRPDRDDNIAINWDNVVPEYQAQFQKMTDIDSYGSPYDIGSVMHYDETAFAKATGLFTISMANGGRLVGYDGEKMSQTDIDQIQIMYQCAGAPPTSTTTTTTTIAPTTPSDCVDKLSQCGQWARKCGRKGMKNFFVRNCAATCGYCNTAGTICNDLLGLACGKLSRFCSRERVQAKCKKTCGVCS